MDNPILILAAKPSEAISLENFFQIEENPFKDLLYSPKYLRYSGWNLLTLDYPKIKEGNSWEANNGDRKKLRLYEDGSFIAIAKADNTFLAWGQDDSVFMNKPRLNTLALVEYVYEFVRFYKEILDLAKYIGVIEIQVSMKNSTLTNGKKLFIVPHKVTDFSYSFGNFSDDDKSISSDFENSIVVNTSQIAEEIAYKIITVIFTKFNVPSDQIPYTKKNELGKWQVAEEQIISNK